MFTAPGAGKNLGRRARLYSSYKGIMPFMYRFFFCLVQISDPESIQVWQTFGDIGAFKLRSLLTGSFALSELPVA